MKKLLLSLGALAAVAAPVAAVVACGSDNGDSAAKTKAIAEFKNLSNYDSMSKTDQVAFDKSMNAMSLDQINKSIEGLKAMTGGAGTAGTPAQTITPETDDEVKAELGTMVKDILADTKYTMDDDQQKALVEELFKLDGSKELKVVDTLPGVKADATHGTDDFMVVISGVAQEEKTATDGYEYMTTPAAPKTRLTLQGVPIAADIDASAKTVEERWGQPQTDLKDANFVLFLQHNEATKEVTVQLSKIFKFDNKIWEYENLTPALKGHVDAAKAKGETVDFDVEEHSLISFTATHA